MFLAITANDWYRSWNGNREISNPSSSPSELWIKVRAWEKAYSVDIEVRENISLKENGDWCWSLTIGIFVHHWTGDQVRTLQGLLEEKLELGIDEDGVGLGKGGSAGVYYSSLKEQLFSEAYFASRLPSAQVSLLCAALALNICKSVLQFLVYSSASLLVL